MRAMVVGGWLLLPTSAAISQEAAGGAAATAEAPADAAATADATSADAAATSKAAPADNATTEGAPTAQPAASTETAPAADAATTADKSGKDATGAGTAATAPATGGTTTTAPTTSGTNPVILGLVIVALFVLPVLAGNYLAKQWKMPDHAWKFSLVLGTLAASILIVTFGEFKFGPDLAGGITLIYELADTSTGPVPAATDGKAPSGTDGTGGDQARRGAPEFTMGQLIAALKERVDPTGTREVTIRPYGQAVEIIIPQQGNQDELDYIKRRLTDLGQLEFRITADPKYTEDRPIIEQAKLAPPAQKEV